MPLNSVKPVKGVLRSSNPNVAEILCICLFKYWAWHQESGTFWRGARDQTIFFTLGIAWNEASRTLRIENTIQARACMTGLLTLSGLGYDVYLSASYRVFFSYSSQCILERCHRSHSGSKTEPGIKVLKLVRENSRMLKRPVVGGGKHIRCTCLPTKEGSNHWSNAGTPYKSPSSSVEMNRVYTAFFVRVWNSCLYNIYSERWGHANNEVWMV